MRAVAERLLFRHPAAAPVVVFSSEQGVFYFVGSNSGRYWEWMLAFRSLQSPFETIAFEFLNCDIRVCPQSLA
jgi:hypothetical protein